MIIGMGLSERMMGGCARGADIGCIVGELVPTPRVFQIFNPKAQTWDSNQQQR
uniref:Uncharacterized protein n=1 Tax=Candidatus Methanogaster sp. ANME-2c ERB4 TaxID=2759911 RepID=A0A7G9Y6A7_9EURY|nr:hypothetical protein HMEJMANM_00010 [Methanosarcinales archaeon ANME-2c ERB4]